MDSSDYNHTILTVGTVLFACGVACVILLGLFFNELDRSFHRHCHPVAGYVVTILNAALLILLQAIIPGFVWASLAFVVGVLASMTQAERLKLLIRGASVSVSDEQVASDREARRACVLTLSWLMIFDVILLGIYLRQSPLSKTAISVPAELPGCDVCEFSDLVSNEIEIHEHCPWPRYSYPAAPEGLEVDPKHGEFSGRLKKNLTRLTWFYLGVGCCPLCQQTDKKVIVVPFDVAVHRVQRYVPAASKSLQTRRGDIRVDEGVAVFVVVCLIFFVIFRAKAHVD